MIVAIKRAPKFSPNSVEKDAAILRSVCQRLADEGYEVRTVGEEEPDGLEGLPVECCLTMGRLPRTLENLAWKERQGTTVVNTAESVRLCCNRRQLNELLKKRGIPVPPEEGCHGYWLKRGDGVAETKNDVRFAADAEERKLVEAEMKAEGITDIVVSAHVAGDLVKFYGVRDQGFFRIFYPGDDGQSKFGDESRNGKPRHYPFDKDALHRTVEQAAQATGTDVYGGDCIIRPDGIFCIIDFNDWPSFSRCREEAAQAIAGAVREKLRHTQSKKEQTYR